MAEWDIKTNRHADNDGHSFSWNDKTGRSIVIFSNEPFNIYMSYIRRMGQGVDETQGNNYGNQRLYRNSSRGR